MKEKNETTLKILQSLIIANGDNPIPYYSVIVHDAIAICNAFYEIIKNEEKLTK